MRDRGNGLKTQPAVYRWTSRTGWVIPTSYEVMRMKAVNHKPMNRPEGTPALQGGEKVSRGIGTIYKKPPFTLVSNISRSRPIYIR